MAAQQLREQLQDLVAHVQQIQDNYEQRLFHDVNTHVAIDVALQEMDREYELQRRRKKHPISSSYEDSSEDSFMSAQEVGSSVGCLESFYNLRESSLTQTFAILLFTSAPTGRCHSV